MAQSADWQRETLPYGTGEIAISIPQRNYVATVMPRYRPGVPDEVGEVRRALANPIGTRRLCDIARGKRSAVIVVNDITRPTASHTFLPPLLEELREAGIADDRILFLVATGTHRDNTREELEGMLGKEILDRFRVLNHHCKDDAIMVTLGTTRDGIPVVINRLFWEAEVKILTATIAPHHGAGFSGGRKSVLPGLASIATLRKHHAYYMRPEQPAMGWLEGNKFHENALEAARMAKVDFILNTVQNHRKEITQVVAGDVEQAWLAGIKTSREIFEVTIPHRVEIVITSPGGYPKDINLWQSQKAMSAAELVVKDGGTVILVAECRDGVGSQGFLDYMAGASRPQDVIERFKREEYTEGSSKAWMYARCINRAELILVAQSIDEETLRRMFTTRADTVEQAIAIALAKHGPDAKIVLLRNSGDMIPRFAG